MRDRKAPARDVQRCNVAEGAGCHRLLAAGRKVMKVTTYAKKSRREAREAQGDERIETLDRMGDATMIKSGWWVYGYQ